jgi:deoxyribodipyrimidine photolyase-like uncharacterized protein
MYWNFLERHRDELSDNDRMKLMYSILDRRSEETKRTDAAVTEAVRDQLSAGGRLSPDDLPG